MGVGRIGGQSGEKRAGMASILNKYTGDGIWEEMTPADIGELKAAVEARRVVSTPNEHSLF